MDYILAIILKDTYSLSQFKHRVRLLRSNFLKTFFGGETENVPLSGQDLNWLRSLPAGFYQKFNKDNVYEIFSELEKETAKLPALTIYLTFEPDDATINQLGASARTSFGPSLMLDIKLDPNLIAGAALVWKGIYKDYSLRAQIAERREEILQEFKKFLR